MDIGNALRRTGREEITIRSIISNTIHDIYWPQVHIHSVNIRGNKVMVKTGNALINSELSLLSWDIKKASLQKLGALGISLSHELKIRFI